MTKDEIINKLIELSEGCLPAVKGELIKVVDALRSLEDCEDCLDVDIADGIEQVSGVNELLRGKAAYWDRDEWEINVKRLAGEFALVIFRENDHDPHS